MEIVSSKAERTPCRAYAPDFGAVVVGEGHLTAVVARPAVMGPVTAEDSS